MGTTLTTNIQLVKPDAADLAKNWVDLLDYQDYNNQVVMAQTNIPVTAYTPVITATTTAPNIGTSGAIAGEYQDFQGVIFGSTRVIFGDTGITVGSGEYAISLPFPVDPAYHSVGTSFNATPGAFSIIGEGFLYDNTIVDNSGPVALDVVTVAGTSYMRMLTERYTTPAKTARFVQNSVPFAVADSDRFILQYMYKRV